MDYKKLVDDIKSVVLGKEQVELAVEKEERAFKGLVKTEPIPIITSIFRVFLISLIISEIRSEIC